MKKLGVIQEKLGMLLLPFRVKKVDRNPKACSFDSAQTIGILYNAENKDTHQQLSQYADFLVESHKGLQIKMLGFLEMTELNLYLHANVPSKFFTADSFSWNGSLMSGDALEFAKEHFDILLDMTTNTNFPTLYISKLSNASYKVGRFIEDDLRYDFMIDTNEDNTLSNLIKQVNVYMSKIRTR